MPRWRARAGGLVAAVIGLALCCAVPAAAAEAPIPLAQRALKAGKAELAVKALNAALASNGLKGTEIARAYYVRGLAQAKAHNPAAAIADLSHALWLKGLSEAERQDAVAAKAAAYQTAGVAAKPEETAGGANVAEAATLPAAEVPAAVKLRKTKVKPVAPDEAAQAPDQTTSAEPLPWASEPTAAPAAQPIPTKAAAVTESSDSSFSSMLGGLFGGGQLTAPPASAPPAAPAATQVAAVEAPQLVTEPVKSRKASLKSGIYLQVASLRSEADAQSTAAKLAGDHAGTLSGVGTDIMPAVIGNMGTFYNVRLGPVASKAAGQTLCAQLRREGVDCFFATP